MKQTELRHWLGLLHAPGLGCRSFNRLLRRGLSPESLFSNADDASLGLHAETLRWLKNPDWHLIDRDMAWLNQADRHCITIQDEAYPYALKEIADPPPILFIQGDVKTLSNKQLALVGSRNPSQKGLKLAYDFAKALSRSGFTITSGLALGIDAASHRGALDAPGITLAVEGNGLSSVYPASNGKLAAEIVAQGGALISELPTATPPKACNFPRRNRIISGLSRGVLVVEASLRSGSLITARMAMEQGREVFALPGSLCDPLARGCNALIKQGAKLVETLSDICEELSNWENPNTSGAEEELDPQSLALLKYVAYEPISVDTLISMSGFSAKAISSMLLLLELKGLVASNPGGCYSRNK